MYSVTYFDKNEHQRHPVFADRDAGVIYAWPNLRDAKNAADGLQGAEVVESTSLPYALRVVASVCRRCGSKLVYADGLCNACFCV